MNYNKNNCIIERIITKSETEKRDIFRIIHKGTGNVLHAIGLAEATKMSELLDLESKIDNWFSRQ